MNFDYWGLFVLGMLSLVYSISFCFVKKLTGINKINIRHIFYSMWILSTFIIFTIVPDSIIKDYGRNAFGFSENIWFGFLIFILGILIYFLIISDKDVNIKENKVNFEEMSQKVNTLIEVQNQIYADLEDKIRAQCRAFKQLGPYVLALKNQDIDYLKELESILNFYLSYQDKSKMSAKVAAAENLIDYGGLTDWECKKIYLHIEQEGVAVLKHKNQFLIVIPYRSIFFVNEGIYLILESDKDFINAELPLIISLLQEFDRVITVV